MPLFTVWTNIPAKFAKQSSKKSSWEEEGHIIAKDVKSDLQIRLASFILPTMLERGAEQVVTTRQNTYEIFLDRGRFNMLLFHMGMQDDLNTVTVDLRPGRKWESIPHMSDEMLGQHRNGNIEVWLGSGICEYDQNRDLARRITNGKIIFPWEHFSGLHTKRLKRYLQKAPRGRGEEFACQLLLNSLLRKTNAVLIHEAQHAVDFSGGSAQLFKDLKLFPLLLPLPPYLISFASLGYSLRSLYYLFRENDSRYFNEGIVALLIANCGFAVGTYLFLKFNPLEKRPNVSMRQHIRDPFWRGIIQIHPQSLTIPKSDV